ncbi:unnamed protein product [Caenorhabditis angaria]|uniref:PAN-3 domain-containing protein n=1 Tax=Caenorhabditis angaria TaxID=860376 RepID=A0A9P1IHZ3_9PELO|nr:unnamed protein product [Caenorhabditis angaria]
MFLKFLLFAYLHRIVITTNLIIVWGSYDTAFTDVLYSNNNLTVDEECWKLLEASSDYEIAFWINLICYLNTYEFVQSVKPDVGKTKKIAFKVSNNITSCPKNFTSAQSTNHKISYDGKYWQINAKIPCENFWSIRDGTVVCVEIVRYKNIFTFSEAISNSIARSETLSSPTNIKKTIDVYNYYGKIENQTRIRVVTDAKRSDSCNTLNKISTSECQYPNGFDFKDPTNPNHSRFKFVKNPTISTEYRCVAMYLDLQDSILNGKFDFIKCYEECDDAYCSYYTVNINPP